MSEADRRKWDQRYRDGAYQSRPCPSEFLAHCVDLLPAGGQALDVACGGGRNAIFLASRGFEVDAVDISPAALYRARAQAGEAPIRWIERDLDDGFHPDRDYHVIVNIRYANQRLVESLLPRLRSGGVLIVEQHLATSDPTVIGPKNPAFRVAPGDLARLASALAVERLKEGRFEDPDGRSAALARLAARKR